MDLVSALQRLQQCAADAYGEGREDNRIAYKRAREDASKNPEPPRINTLLGTNRSMTMARQALLPEGPEKDPSLLQRLTTHDPHLKRVHQQMGMGLSDDPMTRAGQVLGHIGADLTQDRSRELWWLINAPQAVGAIAQELAISQTNPELYSQVDLQIDEAGNPLKYDGTSDGAAVRAGAIDAKSGRLKKGYQMQDTPDGKVIYKRRYNPGVADALMIPAGLAINSGIGLITPFGGHEGYKAAVPSDGDPSKSANPIAEVATKYILGRTGNLLPWNEFKQVRPDVSKDEYMAYKAFKHDKDVDLNPFDDGKVSLPAGVARYTNDGIHGAEVQFLGRSIPVNTGILPTATALIGTALGARRRSGVKGTPFEAGRPVRDGFLGGMGGYVVGSAAGNILEQKRREQNAIENGIIIN